MKSQACAYKGDVDGAVEHVRNVVSDVRNLDLGKMQVIEKLVLTGHLPGERTVTKISSSPHSCGKPEKTDRVMPSIGTRFLCHRGRERSFVDRAED